MHYSTSVILHAVMSTTPQTSGTCKTHWTISITIANISRSAESIRMASIYLGSTHSFIISCRSMPLGLQIHAFGAPNGICSSIMESKHIRAVKEPWWRSSHFEASEQMLLTNQRLNKLAAARVDFADRGMLQGTCLLWILIQLGTSSHVFVYSS